jgi:hypothetical protein
MGVRAEEIRKSECCSVMDQIRVQNLPDHENVPTSDTVLNHVKRLERNNCTSVDDSNSNVTDGRTGLKKDSVYNRVPWKAVFDCRVSQDALPMLEPDEVKISCPVLRRLGTGNSPRLPGDKRQH